VLKDHYRRRNVGRAQGSSLPCGNAYGLILETIPMEFWHKHGIDVIALLTLVFMIAWIFQPSAN
jgi:hypothetical protein